MLFGTVAVVPLVVLATRTAGTSELVSIIVYGVALLTSLVVSAAYNLWPISPLKRILRRIDHSAIYLLIAGTYTPFISQLKGGLEPLFWLAGIWGTSLLGIVLKLRFPGRFDRSSVVLYILIGWSGVMAYDDLVAALPVSTLWLLGIGGVVYTVGVLFHVWESLPFQRAIWHVFVLTAALCHYGAVLDCMVLARVS